jgi:NAD(P)-dependent dehydrogenase (short-subunit alcohol dehydrogenase family)
LPRSEAFRIEYWALEEAKLQRMPPEKEFSRKIALVVGGSSGIGRETVLELAKRGAHVVVADLDLDGATAVAAEAATVSSAEAILACALDLSSRTAFPRPSTRARRFAASMSSTPRPSIRPRRLTPVEAVWTQALQSMTSNHVLAGEAACPGAQRAPATVAHQLDNAVAVRQRATMSARPP